MHLPPCDVHIPRPDGAADPAYAAIPDAPRRGVVVIHEILGRQPEIDRVVERFAAAGYAAVAPDLFSAGFKPFCVIASMRATATGKGPPVEQVLRARQWLLEQTGLGPDAVGVIGFCMGGGFALATGPHWAAVSTNYGNVPDVEVMRGIGPVIGCYGLRDKVYGQPSVDRLRAAMTALGVEHEIHAFEQVGHSFLTDGDHPSAALSRPVLAVGYDPEVAEVAWGHIFAFFERTLRPAGEVS